MDNYSSESNTQVFKPIEVKLKKPVKVTFPTRAPSVVIPERKPVFITADKTTCAECPCFPKESPYMKPPKLRICMLSPLTLYELAAKIVDSLPLPAALKWSEEDVLKWLENVVGLPQYKDCFLNNHINGMRLIRLEDPSVLSIINIRIYDHVRTIISEIKKLYSLEFIKFSRSISVPPRKPLTHCTWFKSKSGPNWGIRQNWKRSDILRWMKIIGPAPVSSDHWDAVWYEEPDYPRTLFGKIPPAAEREILPMYGGVPETCDEYMVPRKFRLDRTRPEEEQLIWMEHGPWSKLDLTSIEEKRRERKLRKTLLPKKICLKGLVGKELLLARRLMPKTKFLKQ